MGNEKTILKLTVTRPSYSNSTNLPMKKMCSICVQGCMMCSARCTFQGWISELQIVTCGARFLCVCNIIYIYELAPMCLLYFAIFICQKCHTTVGNANGQHWLRSRHFFCFFDFQPFLLQHTANWTNNVLIFVLIPKKITPTTTAMKQEDEGKFYQNSIQMRLGIVYFRLKWVYSCCTV